MSRREVQTEISEFDFCIRHKLIFKEVSCPNILCSSIVRIYNSRSRDYLDGRVCDCVNKQCNRKGNLKYGSKFKEFDIECRTPGHIDSVEEYDKIVLILKGDLNSIEENKMKRYRLKNKAESFILIDDLLYLLDDDGLHKRVLYRGQEMVMKMEFVKNSFSPYLEKSYAKYVFNVLYRYVQKHLLEGCSSEIKKWVPILEKVTYDYNVAVHNATNKSPFELMHGICGFNTIEKKIFDEKEQDKD
ncbi:hypothetical protein P3W45_000602 [Vairimorpha bombi]